MGTFISHSTAETESFGARWGGEAKPGLIIGLNGDLGAGKTQWVRGFARGLGITRRVHSPTFTLVNEYEGGRLILYHLDLYRLETAEQILSAGIQDYLTGSGVVVIEWAGKLLAVQSTVSAMRHIQIEIIGDYDRKFIYDDACT